MRAPTTFGLATLLVLGLSLGLALAPAAARAEPLPSGSLGIMFGGGAGTGRYARSLGIGYYQFGAQAAWQPMRTERRIGWSLKWSFVFGRMLEAESARIDEVLRTLQMDFMAGLRVRPGSSSRRYLALRGGVELFRSNEVVMPDNQRAFVGPVAALALEQYAFGAFMFNVDVRYGLIGRGPAEIALLAGVSISVP
ncbi:MAG TPA: hypothetical protein VFD36_13460 [Kofleriaceae bacterium]|jgi:hypothetical protein|nr:hypothetical protein [Kofleriaceae bacterium]